MLILVPFGRAPVGLAEFDLYRLRRDIFFGLLHCSISGLPKKTLLVVNLKNELQKMNMAVAVAWTSIQVPLGLLEPRISLCKASMCLGCKHVL